MSLVSEVGGGGLDGLSQLRALMASGRKPCIPASRHRRPIRRWS